jgi:hypothetical protein
MQRDVFRARIILSCEEGGRAEEISTRRGLTPALWTAGVAGF